MADNRQSYQLIDNQVPLSLIPKTVIEKFDAGILRKEVHQINEMEGATNYGYNYQSKATFRFNKNNSEHLKGAKIRGKWKLAGSATVGTVDGNALSLVNQINFKKTNSTDIEQVQGANRLALSHKLSTSHILNCDNRF